MTQTHKFPLQHVRHDRRYERRGGYERGGGHDRGGGDERRGGGYVVVHAEQRGGSEPGRALAHTRPFGLRLG